MAGDCIPIFIGTRQQGGSNLHHFCPSKHRNDFYWQYVKKDTQIFIERITYPWLRSADGKSAQAGSKTGK
jgi:hypothetical protein